MSDGLQLAIIACDVLRDEIEHFASRHEHVRKLEFFEMGLHDRPDKRQHGHRR